MKRVILFIAFCISFQVANGRDIAEIMNQREQKCLRYSLRTDLLDAHVIQMPYGSSTIVSSIDHSVLKNARVHQIDLVYSDFPKDIDLTQLNKERLLMLSKINTRFFKDNEINWRIIRQIGCKNESEAKVLFHGIVIHYKGPQTEEEWLAEQTAYREFLPERITSSGEAEKLLHDKSILTILDRNKQWKNMAIVADLTGSMSPYTQQLVFWFKLRMNDKRMRSLTFFNDGNMTPDASKIIGNTGGIYHERAKDYEQARDLALKTISNGNGGDGAENDIEALLYASERLAPNEELILIADNNAPIKDFVLLDKITQPVHIILCGAHYGVNVQYLELAYRTKGSVHTMEQDLNDLFKKNEGERIVIGREVFEVKDGTIQKVLFKRT